MSLKNIIGVDHAVVVVNDLDGAAQNWKRLGFTVSPRGTHSAKMGTGNTTIMLGEDYLELLGVLDETEHNAPTRAFLARTGGGIERVAFTTLDASAGAEEIRARGYPPIGPTDFERPVTLPDGRQSAAKFATFQWPIDQAPGGVRLFACQHKTRDTVWIPELQHHANTAKQIERILIVSPDPKADAGHLSTMIDAPATGERDGTWLVPSGPGRADFVFFAREGLGRQYPGVPMEGLPERGGIGLVLAVDDPASARRALGATAVQSGDALVVPVAAGNNAMLAFVAK
jgi:Glyoxalase-like domain